MTAVMNAMTVPRSRSRQSEGSRKTFPDKVTFNREPPQCAVVRKAKGCVGGSKHEEWVVFQEEGTITGRGVSDARRV